MTVKGDTAYRGDVDGLRALAVAMVVLFHAWPARLPGGFAGVDIFFVISGYLITGIILSKLDEKRFSVLDFFSRRIRRIGPALVVVLLGTLALGFVAIPFVDYRALGLQATAGSGFSANILFWFQAGYFDSLAIRKPLLHLWSLGVEEQFYLIWPPLMILAAALGARWWTIVLSVVGLSFIVNVSLIADHPDATFYLLPGRLWELGLGGILARHHQRGPLSGRGAALANLKSGLGLGLIAVSAGVLHETFAFPGWWAVLPVAGTMLVIDAGPDARINRLILASRPFQAIGLISYPIYLWHWPLLVFERVAGHSGATWKIGAIALTVVLSYLTYRLIEVPIRFGRFSGRRPGGALVVPGILCAMILTAALGQLAPIWQRHAHKLPPVARAFEDYRFDAVTAYREGRCFLNPDQTAADFGPECDGGGSDQPLVVLWGDSHAAHLYPGLAAEQQRPDRNFRLAQYTASGCPPISGITIDYRPNCRAVNQAVEARIGQLRPDTVILTGYWDNYVANPGSHFSPDGITRTIQRLIALGVARVVVLGPVPTWDTPPPQAILRQLFRGITEVPERLTKYLRPEAFRMEGAIRSAAIAGGGLYLSAIDTLCVTPGGCLATVPTAHGPEPIAWDYGHFTTAGSIAFIEKLRDTGLVPVGLSAPAERTK